MMIRRPQGFADGYTAITSEGERELDVGMDFGIHRQAPGIEIREAHLKESAWLLMGGAAEIDCAGRATRVERRSLFNEPPTVLHVGPRTPVVLRSLGRVEWVVARASNTRRFEPRLFLPGELEPEYRGSGLAQGTCLRNVRLVFDRKARPESNLVLGEVINFPGRWSSYPPHHHPQPEIYHYRFTLPQGYGHAELGERVFKVRAYDTLKIKDGATHAQVSAPGYGMYYLWVVRHLQGNPYTGFEYEPEHRWILEPKNQGWLPPGSPLQRRQVRKCA